MFEMSGFEAGSAAIALTGAVLGWSLRPIFLRYRRAFVVAAAVLAAAGATAYDAFETRPASQQPAPVAASRAAPAPAAAAPSTTQTQEVASGTWADYLERAGHDAFVERDYAAAARYWRDASRQSPRHAAALEGAVARAEQLAAERL
jgi:hypothetical protein